MELRVPQLRPPQGLPSPGPCWRPLTRLLDPAVRVAGWTGELRAALRSAVTSCQWPQVRKHGAWLAADPRCCLCIAVVGHSDLTPVGSLAHRSLQCRCQRDLRQAHAPRDVLEYSGDPNLVKGEIQWLTGALATRAYEGRSPRQMRHSHAVLGRTVT